MIHLLKQLLTTQQLTKTLLFCFAVITISACSYSPKMLKDSYNNLGKEYAKELKQLSDITPEQSAGLDTFADDLMIWHRKNRLPVYANLVKKLSLKIESPQGPSKADFYTLMKLIKAYPNFYESHSANLKMATLATTLSDKQFAQISERINEETRDFTEHFQQITWEKRKRNGVKSLSNILSYLNVNLTNTQLDIARKHSNYYRDLKNIYIESNEKWNNTLIELLSKRHEQGFVKKFTAHMQNDNLHKRLSQTAPVETKHNDQISANMYKELFASLTKQQKVILASQLKSINKTVTELIDYK